ncbi:MAG: hypothetical protein HQK51_11190 [Oligoflexia bacterium]|nr:hypothetical protein [Oligoflexia bacterium]
MKNVSSEEMARLEKATIKTMQMHESEIEALLKGDNLKGIASKHTEVIAHPQHTTCC